MAGSIGGMPGFCAVRSSEYPKLVLNRCIKRYIKPIAIRVFICYNDAWLKLASLRVAWDFAYPPRYSATPRYTPLARPHRKTTTVFVNIEREKLTNMADKTLQCRDCGTSFTFTEGEQAFYAQKGYSEPMRCPSCRAAKKASRSGGYGDSYGGGSGYGSYGGNGGGYGRSERTMTQVVCANCGKDTEVPFVPRGDKPVYCSDCFSQMGGGNRSGGRNRY